MASIGAVPVPTTSIAGVSGPRWQAGPFRGEVNDGVVALSEVSVGWIVDQVELPILHTLLPMSSRAAAIILARLGRTESQPESGEDKP